MRVCLNVGVGECMHVCLLLGTLRLGHFWTCPAYIIEDNALSGNQSPSVATAPCQVTSQPPSLLRLIR